MSYDKPPKSLRLDKNTEERLNAMSIIQGVPASELIRRYLTEGLDEASKPENIERVIQERTQKFVDAGNRLAELATEAEIDHQNTDTAQ